MGDAIRCPVIDEYEALLAMPKNQAIGNLKRKNSELHKANITLREKIDGLKESNEALRQEPDALRKELKSVKAFAEKQSDKLAAIKVWFADNDHRLAPKETIVQKLDNMESIIRSRGQQINEMKEAEAKRKGKKPKPKKSNSLGLAKKFGGLQ